MKKVIYVSGLVIGMIASTGHAAIITQTSTGETESYAGSCAQAVSEARSDGWSVSPRGDNTYYVTGGWSGNGYYTCVDGGAGNPSSATTIIANKIIRTQVFQQAKPLTKDDDGSTTTTAQSQKIAGADLFVNFWEAGEAEGQTIGINPSYSIGDRHAFTFTLPLYVNNPDEGDGYKTVGLDGSYRFSMTDNFAAGVHANAIGYFSDGDGDDTSNISFGPYVSYLWQFTEKLGLSVGALLEFTEPEEGDGTQQLIPGANLGIQLNDSWALNVYSVFYAQFDDEYEDYVDGGVEAAFSKGLWSMSFGLKNSFGLDDYSSTEIYIGSNWQF